MKRFRNFMLYLLAVILMSSSIPLYAEEVESAFDLQINEVVKEEDSYEIKLSAYNNSEDDHVIEIAVSDNNVIYDQETSFTDFGHFYVENNKIYLNLKSNLIDDNYDFILKKDDNEKQITLKWNDKEYTEKFDEVNKSLINDLTSESIFTLDKGEDSIEPKMSGTKLEMRMKFKVNSNSTTNGDIYGNMNIRLKFDRTYINYTSINPTKPGQLEGSFITRPRNYDDNYYIVDYTFTNVNYGADVDFPINFAAMNGQVPNNAKLIVSGEMMKDDVIVSTSVLEFVSLNEMDSTKIERYLVGKDGYIRTSTNEIYGGEEDKVKTGYLETDVNKIESISFFLRSDYADIPNKGGVEISKYVAKEYLPKEAVFDAERSIGWTYDESTHTATKEFTGKYLEKYFLGSTTVDFTEGAYDSVPYKFYLKFPGLKIDSKVNTKFEIDAYPKENLGFPEKYSFSQEKVITVSKRPPRKYNDNLYNGGSMDRKIYNTETAKSTEDIHLFGMSMASDSRDYAENLSFSTKLDERYQIKDIEIPVKSKNEFDGTLDIYYYLENDSQRYLLSKDIDISKKVNSKDMGYSYRFDESLTVVSIEVETSDNSKVYLQDKKGADLKFRVRNILKDVNTDLKAGSIVKHESTLKGNLATLSTVNNTKTTKLTVTEPTPSLELKLSTSSKVTNIKTPIKYELTLIGEFLNKGLVIDFDKAVVMLPVGFDYIKGTSALAYNANGSEFGFTKDDISDEPDVVLNYKGTGQNAMVWELPQGITQSENLFSRIHRIKWNFELEANKFATEGKNDISAYLVLEDQGKLIYHDRYMTNDIHDFNDNNRNDDLIYFSDTNINYIPPFELMVQKELKGGLDKEFLVNPNIAKTELDMVSDYRLKIFNNTETKSENATIVEVLPHKGDKTISLDPISQKQVERKSEFDLRLTEEIAVSNGFKVQYSKEVPNYDNGDFLNSVVWHDHLDNIEDARAFKISGGTIDSKEEVNFIAKVKIADNQILKNDNYANGSFGISTDKNIFSTFESNIMPLELVHYSVKGNIWTDFNHDSINNDVLAPITNHKVSLVDTNGNVVKDINNKAYETVTDANGDYEIKFHKNGTYKVKIDTPDNHELTDAKLDNINGSHIINDGKALSDEFTVNANKRVATKNAGFKRDVIFKVKNTTLDANSGILNNTDLFTYSLTVDGSPYNGIGKTLTGNDVNVLNGEFTLRTNEEAIFNDISSNVEYTIKQFKHDKYEIISENDEFTAKTHSDISHTFENKFVVEKTSITVEKDWGTYDLSKPNIEIQLYRDGAEYLAPITLVDGELNYTWSNLDKSDVYGNDYEYTVDEITVLENFTKKVEGFKITNTYVSPVIDIESEIDWNGYLLVTPDFEIQLYRDGIPYLDSVVMEHSELLHVWNGLKKTDDSGIEYEYTVDVLDDLEHFTTEIEEYDFINTYVSPKRDVMVEVDWGLYTKVKPDIEIQLIRDGKAYLDPITLIDGETTYTYPDLDVADEFGVDYTYTIVESGDLDNFEISISGLKIKNTYVSPSFDLNINKVWKNYEGIKPTIQVQLYRDGVAYLEAIELKDGEENYTFKDLLVSDETGKVYEYTIDEITVLDNFEKEVDGFTITNTYKKTNDKALEDNKEEGQKPIKDVNTAISNNEYLMMLTLILSAIFLVILKKRVSVKY